MNPDRFNDYHIRNTTDTGIMRVGREFARVMPEQYGIPVLHSQRLHDSDGFLRSYINSLDTITRILADNDQVEVVLDLHRDGVANADLTTTINGQQVAQILIVVTTDDYGLPHPNWRRNLAFARFLHERMEEMYPVCPGGKSGDHRPLQPPRPSSGPPVGDRKLQPRRGAGSPVRAPPGRCVRYGDGRLAPLVFFFLRGEH